MKACIDCGAELPLGGLCQRCVARDEEAHPENRVRRDAIGSYTRLSHALVDLRRVDELLRHIADALEREMPEHVGQLGDARGALAGLDHRISERRAERQVEAVRGTRP